MYLAKLCLTGVLMPLLLSAPVRETSKSATIPGSRAMWFTGFGSDTPGGKGGRVIKVTNLNRDGEGSLKAALEASGPRIIVFEVGGIIDWRKEEVKVSNGRLTVAGETAPSPGITIIRGNLIVSAPDVIVRHLRVRLGDGGDLKTPNWEADSLAVVGPNAKNVLIDHCSTSWSIDENLSVSGPRVKNGTACFVTLRNCIVAEALNNSTHPKGPHSKGTLIHDFVHDVAIAGNFYTHNINRHPYLKPNTNVFMANTLINDPGNAAIHFAYVPNEYKVIPDPMLPGQITSVGNVMRPGASTQPDLIMYTYTPKAPAGVGKLYQRDSLVYDRDGNPVWNGVSGTKPDQIGPQIQIMPKPMLWPKGFTPLPAAMTEAYVLKNAGARPKDRDAVDKRLVQDYLQHQGKVIDSQEEVGGYPKVDPPTHRKLNVPSNPAAVEKWLAKFREEVEY